MYDVIAAPPLLAGAVNDTAACAFPAVAETSVGVPGTVDGVTGLDGSDDSEEPALFVATTVNV